MGAAIAVALAVAVASAAVLTMAVKALNEARGRADAEKRCGEQRARADAAETKVTSLATQLADRTTQHREEKERAERLDKVIAELLVEMATAPAAGSYGRLLKVIAAAKAPAGSDGDGSRGMYQPGPPVARADTDLLDPSDDSE